MRVRALGAEVCARVQGGRLFVLAGLVPVWLFLLTVVTARPVAAQSTPWAIPGGIQAEDFDSGAAGVAYRDNTPGNNGGVYRSTDVDIATTPSGGYTVGWVGAGEWLRYTVNVTSSGNYNIVTRVASAGAGGTFHIEFNGVNKTGALRVPDTGGWNSYQDLAVVVSLEAGVQTMRLVFDTAGSTNAVGNVGSIRVDKTSSAATATTGGAVSSPFGGSARAIPGTIQTEDFDHGGSGVGYLDNSSGNSGGYYRSTDVDIASTPSGGATVGWVGAGEWLQYTVNVASSGNYTLVARVASAGTGGTFHLAFKGQNKTGALRVPSTGSWGSYTDLRATVSLEAGQQTMRIVFESNGGTGAVGNFHYLRFENGGTTPTPTPAPAPTTSTPYGGTARAIPGGIQAEDFDNGGQGVGYRDNSSGNSGGVYRSTDVDIAKKPDGGYAVGWVGAGEWLQYSVNVKTSGTYTVAARVASPGTGGTFHIEFNGQDKTGAMRVPATGSWTTYTDVRATVSLSAGTQAMRVVFDTDGSGGSVGNISYVEFTSGTSVVPPPPSPTPTGGKLRVMTWNIHFGHGDPWGQAQEIAATGAHVALLQEASTYDENMPVTYVDRLRQLTGQAWYSAWGPMNPSGGGSQGTLILSRFPIVTKTPVVLSGAGIVRALIDVGGVQVNVFSVHLEWSNTSLRSAQLQDFMDWSRRFSGPRIAGGDFNSWWGEWWIKEMETEHTDTWQDVTGSDENGYTLNGAVRFDYLFRAFVDNWRLTPGSCWVRSTSKSDHYPVIAEYAVR